VSELYDYFDLQNTLFPLTRSCEQYTDDFTQHCDNCWFCGERKWGFGRL
jgi:7-cyano-7-deazaguanine synthase in queuosine biosynthesis